MLTRSSYLDWISCAHRVARHNLAASGIPALSAQEMRLIEPRWLDDPVCDLAQGLAQSLGLRPEEILPCNGASQALWLGYAGTLESGDEALIESPAYAPFATAPLTLEATVCRFYRSADDGYAIDVNAILRKLTSRTRVVAVSHLHNPSGCRADPAAIAVLADAMSRNGGYVIVNEIYAPFAHLSSRGPALRTYRGIAPNLVCVGSLSKAFGLGPERIGWMAGPPGVIKRAAAAQLASTGDMPRCWAAAALGALEHLPRLGARAYSLVEGNRERVKHWIEQRPELAWSDPEDGLFGLVRLPCGMDGREFAHNVIERHDVAVAPGEFFDAPSTFRLAWACPAASLDLALCALGEALSELGVAAHPEILIRK